VEKVENACWISDFGSSKSAELRQKEMAEEEDMWQRGVRLVSDLDSILEFDPYMYVVSLPPFSVSVSVSVSVSLSLVL